ncbi:MAG: lytic murein transglycosylase [Desulfovibrio sp.]|nr:lytic murein transglycosylase [Desulfovibrio sp.]
MVLHTRLPSAFPSGFFRRVVLCLALGCIVMPSIVFVSLTARAAEKRNSLEFCGNVTGVPSFPPDDNARNSTHIQTEAQSGKTPASKKPPQENRSRQIADEAADGTPTPNATPALDHAWHSLLERLEADGFERKQMEKLFISLGSRSYSPAYMAAKISELYGVGGIGINRAGNATPEPPENYEQPLSDVTIGSCMEFIKKYAFDLAAIEDRYGVPTRVIIAVLLVETNLGLDLGNDSALRALASMAATSTPDLLGQRGNAGQTRRVRLATLRATLKAKSDWAYNEVKELLSYAGQCGADAGKIPGSIYGAIGICQFMPSSAAFYGVDGDKDGKVDLFSPLDAMYSVANYLDANGWRDAKTHAQQLAVIRTYNRDNVYAARVLGVSNRISRAIAGKVPAGHNALAGIGSAFSHTLDAPGLRRTRRYGAKIPYLGSYQSILQ